MLALLLITSTVTLASHGYSNKRSTMQIIVEDTKYYFKKSEKVMNGLIKQLFTPNFPVAQLAEHKTEYLRRTYQSGFKSKGFCKKKKKKKD